MENGKKEGSCGVVFDIEYSFNCGDLQPALPGTSNQNPYHRNRRICE